MSDYTVRFDNHEGKWCIFDIDMLFDCFDTEAEAIHEKHLLDTTIQIENDIYKIGKMYHAEHLNHFINCFNMYAMKDIWRDLLE